jgi:hypothetical protein
MVEVLWEALASKSYETFLNRRRGGTPHSAKADEAYLPWR